MRGTSGGGAPNSLMYALVHSSSDTKLSATAHRDSEPRHAKRDCRHQTIARHAAARHADIALRERGHRPTVAFLVIVTSACGGRYLENWRPFGSATMGGGWFKEFCTPQAPHLLPPAAAGVWYEHPKYAPARGWVSRCCGHWNQASRRWPEWQAVGRALGKPPGQASGQAPGREATARQRPLRAAGA